MTRTTHKAHATPGFPVYCLGWADDETVLLGGGGGASKSGIENKIKIAKVSKDARSLTYVHELKLSADEDAPMTMAVDGKSKRIATGINASQSSIEGGKKNEHLRTFGFSDTEISLQKSTGSIDTAWSDDYPYQKHTAISPSGTAIVAGTTDDVVSVYSYPDLQGGQNLKMEHEVVDLHWGGEDGKTLLVVTTKTLVLYRLTEGDKIAVEEVQTIYAPSLDIAPVVFRAARLAPSTIDQPQRVHAVLNSAGKPRKGQARKAWVVTLAQIADASHAPVSAAEKQSGVNVDDLSKRGSSTKDKEEEGRWDVVARREVSAKPVTVFDASADGKLVAYGSSDLAIGILDAKTLSPLLKILHVHDFPPTALRFNPSATMLLSASADNTVRAIVVPTSFGSNSFMNIAFIIALIIFLIAYQMRS